MLVKLFYFANALLMRRKKRPIDQAAIDSKNFLEMEGEVLELLPAGAFKIMLPGGNEVLAHLSGKMRMHKIRLAPGDRVRMEISPYDLTKGRITYRL